MGLGFLKAVIEGASPKPEQEMLWIVACHMLTVGGNVDNSQI